MTKRLLALCGMPGSGKTSIAKELERIYQYKIYDIDLIIEKKFNLSIPEIFLQYGQNKFRESETDVISNIITLSKTQDNVSILSLGGGALYHNMKTLKEHTCLVYLKIDLETLYQRLSLDKNIRPLITDDYGNISKQKLQDIYNTRQSNYSECDITLNGKVNLDQLVEELHKIIINNLFQ